MDGQCDTLAVINIRNGFTSALMPTDSQQTSDEQLMLQYGQGDASAFEIVYYRHRDALFRFVLRQVNNQVATAEELFQDVWSNIIRSRGQYKSDAKFTTYLYQVARNKIIDYFRRQNVRPLNADYADTDCLNADSSNDPLRRIESEDCVEQLHQLVDELPSEQREAFVLRHEGEHSVECIADITGVTHETTKSRLRYAIKKLREWLPDECL